MPSLIQLTHHMIIQFVTSNFNVTFRIDRSAMTKTWHDQRGQARGLKLLRAARIISLLIIVIMIHNMLPTKWKRTHCNTRPQTMHVALALMLDDENSGLDMVLMWFRFYSTKILI